MSIDRALGGIPVADLDTALVWWERLLGRPADAAPMPGLFEWHFASSGGIQLVQDKERAGSGLLTLLPDDMERFIAAATVRGLAIGAINTGERARFVAVTDPEGNTITIAGTMPSGEGR